MDSDNEDVLLYTKGQYLIVNTIKSYKHNLMKLYELLVLYTAIVGTEYV